MLKSEDDKLTCHKATARLEHRILVFDEMAARAGSHYTDRTLGLGIKTFMGPKQL